MASKLLGGRAVKSSKRRSRAVSHAVLPLEKRLMFSFYTAGDLVVYRAGTGSTLSSAAAPISLDEYTTAATNQSSPVATVALPTAVNGSIIPLEASGSAASQGYITLSQDGSSVVVPGYDATTGTGSLTGTTSTVQREADVVDSTGTVTSQTLLGTGSAIGTIYGAASLDGVSGVYGSGSLGAEYASPVGSSASVATVLSGSANAMYAIEINNGQLYGTFSATGGPILATIGTGTPTGGSSATKLPGVNYSGTSGSGVGYSRAFAFATLNPADTSPDTLYVADNYNDDVDKLSLVNGSWVLNGTIGAYASSGTTEITATGIAAQPVASGEQIFISTKNAIYTVTDTYGYNSSGPSAAQGNTVFVVNPTLNLVATAATNEGFYGLTWAPAPTTGLSAVINPPSTVTAVAGTSTTIFAAANPGVASTVQWQYMAPGGSWTNITNGTDGHGVVASGATTNTLSLSNLSTAESGYEYQAVFTSATATGNSTAETLTVIIAPAIISINPTGGVLAGGTTVTITGSNFVNGDTVNFGSVAATSVTYNSPTQLTAVSPSEAAGTVDVTVSNAGVTSAIVAGDKYTFVNLPTVTGLYNLSGGISSSNTETSGIDSGGDQVVITGTNLAGATNVSFGGIAAKSFYYNTSLGALVAVSPADTTGTLADVVVTNPAASSVTSSADQFTYTLTTIAGTESPNLLAGSVISIDDNPTITQILEIAGATVSDINGNSETYGYSSFYIEDSTGSEDVFGAHDTTGASSLPGGYIPATGNTISITAIEVPYQQTPELGTISAISTTGTSSNYAPVVPVVETIPHVDTAAPLPTDTAGYIVTIKGVYISGLTEGGQPLTTFQLNNTSSGGMITDTAGNSMSLYYATTYNQAAITGPSDGNFTGSIIGNLVGVSVPTSNLVDVTGYVDINNSGTTELELLAITNPSTIAPVLLSSNPSQGPLGGNNTVTITGDGLTGTTSVSFGGTPGTNVSVVNDNTVTVTAPSHVAGTVNLTVTNENGVSNALSYIYTTAPTVSGVTPGGVSTTGTNASGGTPNIVITGTGFTGATAVNFGGTVVTSSGFTVNSSTQITVTAAPAHAAGSVDVTVTAPAPGGGSVTSSPSASDKFIYDTIPTVSISPTSGADSGGTSVVISGSSLLGTSAVSFGGAPATSFTYNASNSTVTAVAPAGTLGNVVDVKVTNYAGTSATVSTDKYTYTATTVSFAQNASLGVYVAIDSNPVITAILSQPGTVNGETYPYYAFLIDDGTGSEDIFYNPTKQAAGVASFVPVVGNTIQVTGVIANFRQIDEMGGSGNGVITSISNTGTAAVPAPIAETVSAVNIALLPQGTGFGSHLITLSNVIVGGQTTAVVGTATQTLTANDSTGQMTLFVYNTSYSTTNEQFTGALFPAGPETLTGFVYVFTSGSTNTAEFVPVLDNSTIPAWLAPSSQAIWNRNQKTLYVNGASTIISDPGADEPAIVSPNTQNSASVLNIVTATGGQIHIGGLTLTAGASVNMNTSTGKPAVLLVNSGGNFSIDATSTLNISDNFVDIPNGNLGNITTLAFNGYNNGAWNGAGGIVSSTAATDSTHLTAVGVILNQSEAVGNPILYPTLDGATLGSNDVLIRETYYGDANLSGAVDGSDYSLIDNGFESGLTGWYNGDFNYDTVIDGSDYTLIDNAFNSQGAHLAAPSALLASAATPKTAVATSAAVVTSTSIDSFFSQKKVSTSLISEIEDLITSN